jgi:hypothetical protein
VPLEESQALDLAAHLNPTVLYLCQEIEKADASFRVFQNQAQEGLRTLTTEYGSLKKEAENLLKIKEYLVKEKQKRLKLSED